MRIRAKIGGMLPLLSLALLLVPQTSSAQLGPPEMFLGWGDRSNAQRGNNASATATAPHPSVARIIVPNRDGMSFGSGTLVDVHEQHGLVLTNWHVVNEASDEITVRFPDGFVSGGKLLKADKTWDLAALAIWRPRCAPVSLASHPPQPGEMLSIAGYGHGTYRFATGRCTRYFAPQVNLPQEWVELSVAARQGDSGGPIFNQQGELAGVLFGASSNSTLGSYCGRVSTFLTTVLPPKGDTTTMIAARPASASGSARSSTTPMTSVESSTRLRGLEDPFAQPVGSLEGQPPASSRSELLAHPAHFPAPRFPTPPVKFNEPEATFATADGYSPPQQVPRSPLNRPTIATNRDELTWEQFAGKTPIEQGKTILAAIGGLSVVLVALRWLGR